MNRDEFEDAFKSKAMPWLNRFHQWATDAQGNRVVFWTVMALAAYGAARLIW